MPQRRAGWVNWRTSEARKIILEDLEPGGILDSRHHLSVAEVWEFYRSLEGFENVLFSQFEKRLIDHRKQAKNSRDLAARDLAAVEHDRQLLPRDRHNERGELVFDMHPAKLLLREDVKNGVHRRMTPDYMHRSTRPEYKLFKGEIFRHRIYQEVRLQKYFNYLELKRTKESPTRRRQTRERREAQCAAPSPSEQQQHPSIAAMDLNN